MKMLFLITPEFRSAPFIHSFIHYEDLYGTSSRLLPESAPYPCTAKKNSLQAGVECVRMKHEQQSQFQWKTIPCTQRGMPTCMPCGSTTMHTLHNKRKHQEPKAMDLVFELSLLSSLLCFLE